MCDRAAVVVCQPPQVGICVKIRILGGQGFIERQKDIGAVIEHNTRQASDAERATKSEDPIGYAQPASGGAPREQARSDPGPRNARDEHPEEAITTWDGSKFASGGVGLEMSVEKTGPLHPTSVSRDAHADSHGQNDPTRSIATGLLGSRITRDEPPCRSPSHPRKEASCATAIAGAPPHRPRHAAQRSEKQDGQKQIVRQAASAFDTHSAEANCLGANEANSFPTQYIITASCLHAWCPNYLP